MARAQVLAYNSGLTERVHAVRDHLVVALRAYRKTVADLNLAAVFHRAGPMTARRGKN